MKKTFALAAVCILNAGLLYAQQLIVHQMSAETKRTMDILQTLKLQQKTHEVGAPIAFEVTDATIDYLKAKTIVIGNDGTITVKPPADMKGTYKKDSPSK